MTSSCMQAATIAEVMIKDSRLAAEVELGVITGGERMLEELELVEGARVGRTAGG